MSENKITAFNVAATYVGSIVGAGFASGQEILQFITVFREKGLWELGVITALFALFGYIVVEIGSRVNAKSHLEVVRHVGGSAFTNAFDYMITFFLFGALTAMIAGAGAALNQQLGIPSIIGNVIMASIAAITVIVGLSGIINSLSIMVPFLMISTLAISIGAIFFMPQKPLIANTSFFSLNLLMQNWALAAVLYVSYNIILSIAILGPLGVVAKYKNTMRNGIILGSIGLGLGAAAIHFALYKNIDIIKNVDVPMAYLAGKLSFVLQIIYLLAFLIAVYSTAVGSLYGFTARVGTNREISAKPLIIGVTVLAVVASQFGFTNLVKYLYPIGGYGGIILLILLLYSRVREKSKQL